MCNDAHSLYEFRYRLLASVDIIGSTAFKSAQARANAHWAHVFRNFFDDFPHRLNSAFDRTSDEGIAHCKPAQPMRVWKFVGDEILFAVRLKTHEEVVFHSVAFKDAIETYSRELTEKYGDLALKGTIWGAGFPVLNVDVDTQIDDHRISDYLGPSIDLGFRLASQADIRRIPLSADVAYMILYVSRPCLTDHLFGAC